MNLIKTVAAVFVTAMVSQYAVAHGGGYVNSASGVNVVSGSGSCVVYGSGTEDYVEGCSTALDSDGDGVMDKDDQCPNTPQGVAVDATGCPLDDDGDGVPNYLDQCPDTSAGAKVDAKGCYLVIKEDVSIELQVNFATDSAKVPAADYAEVQRVAQFMKEYPLTNVVVEGHTDNRGSDAYNKRLSQKRADSVAALLTSEYGVDASRVSSVGYGEERPLVPNTSRDNMAQNRRSVAVVSATVEKIAK